MAETKYVGKTVRSKEGPRHVSGRGQFIDDFTLPGMLYGLVLRSPYPHARILEVDAQLLVPEITELNNTVDLRHVRQASRWQAEVEAAIGHRGPE